ncbi:CDP-alcohol phosphatidyltransferase family protein [Chloroflexota bacterium]
MKRSKVTIAEIRAQTAVRMFDDLGITDKYASFWGHVILRGASPYPAWLFIRLGISGNTVTILSFVIGCIGAGLLAFGNYYGMIVAAVLLNIWIFLDYVDGAVARGSNNVSKYGFFLDCFNDIIPRSLILFALGIAAFSHTDSHLNWLTYSLLGWEINQSIFLILGGWAAAGAILSWLVVDRFIAIFSSRPSDYYKFGVGDRLLTLIRRIVGNVRVSFTVILLLAVIFGFLGSFLLLYAFYHTADFIFIFVKVMNKARVSGQ